MAAGCLRISHRDGKFGTVNQLIYDVTRYDVGSRAYQQHEKSHDAHDLLGSARLGSARAIKTHGAPRELLSDNSKALNHLRSGTIGAVELILASKGSMPVSGPLSVRTAHDPRTE